MPYTLTINFNKPMPLFPLASCVLLPHATVPLHIFEHRYRAMTRQAIDSNGLIAMSMYSGVDGELDHQGNPVIHPCVCVGYIVHHQSLPDGRYNILLQGIARAAIRREVEPDPEGFRQSILRPLDRGKHDADLEPFRHEIESLLSGPELTQLTAVSTIQNWLTPELPTTAVVDLAWHALSRNCDQRYSVLAQPCPVERAERLLVHLRGTAKTLERAKRMGPCISKHGWPLN